MTVEEAAKTLASMYQKGLANREQAVSVHLFGIKYAYQIEGMSLKELAIRAGIPHTYATEIRKGMNLAKYVQVKG